MYQNFPLGSCFIWILRFSILKASMDFTQFFVATCFATSHPFGFTYRSKRPTLDIIKLLVTALRNQDNKVSFIRVDEDGALVSFSELMKTCHNMTIIVHTTGGDASSLNGKNESHNKTLANIKRVLLMNSSHKKQIWCFAYQYAICLSLQTDNRLRGDISFIL